MGDHVGRDVAAGAGLVLGPTTVWPQTSCRRLPTSRAVMSVEPPGVNGTTIFTGFAGQSPARAREEQVSDGAAMAGEADEMTAVSAWAHSLPRVIASIGSGLLGRVVAAGCWQKSMHGAVVAPKSEDRVGACRRGLFGVVFLILCRDDVAWPENLRSVEVNTS